jgi:hypothetical protein
VAVPRDGNKVDLVHHLVDCDGEDLGCDPQTRLLVSATVMSTLILPTAASVVARLNQRALADVR